VAKFNISGQRKTKTKQKLEKKREWNGHYVAKRGARTDEWGTLNGGLSGSRKTLSKTHNQT